MSASKQAIGASVRRIDGRLKVTGAARYAADHAGRETLNAYGVFSTIASGRVTAIDETDARRVPGVVEIFHHQRFPKLYRVVPASPASVNTAVTDERRPPFHDDRVSYAGQFVALVVADTFEHAREAAFRVKVKYEPGPVVTNLAEAMRRTTIDGGYGHARGDAGAAWQRSAQRIDAVYRTPVETHNPIEMHASVAHWRDGVLYLQESSQGVTTHRTTIASVFGLSTDQVQVESAFIGSGFGGKLFMWPHSVACSAAARELGRAVRLVVPRAQMFTTTGHRPETHQRLRLSADAQGKITSVLHESVNETSVTDQYVETCGSVSTCLYSCADVLVTHKVAQVHRGPATSMRAPGAAPGLFALESAIDELALAVHQDPLAFRLKNISARDESMNLPWSSNHLPEAMERGAERFGWSRRNPTPGSMRDGREIVGYGMAACNWDAWRLPAEARVHLTAKGTAEVTCATQDIGTGTYTIVAQTVADATGLPLERIDVRLGSSAFPAAPVSGGSWATASTLPAVLEAARAALAELKRFAVTPGAPFAGAKEDSLQIADGRIGLAGKSVPFADVLNALGASHVEGQVRTPGAPQGQYSFRSFGAHFVEVRWDPGISRLRVARVVSAIDAGRIVNPLTARNQVEGAIIMAIGMALFEATEYDERTGRPGNDNFAEYAVPVHADQPDIDVLLLDHPDLAFNEIGARGIGEIGTTGLAAAVANAVWHATGIRVRDLPIVKEKLMKPNPRWLTA